TGQFYAMNFLKTVQNIDSTQVDMLLGIALILGTPFFVFFGWLSDKIGRKTIMMTGMLLAVLLYRPIYKAMYETTNVQNKNVSKTIKHIPTCISEIQKINNSKTTIYYTDGTFKDEFYIAIEKDNEVQVKTKNSVLYINNSDKWFL